MKKAVLFFTLISTLSFFTGTSIASQQADLSSAAHGPVFIQIFKEEKLLELYVKEKNRYQLVKQYPICKYSGGLGPKQLTGDLKSPEGFYQVKLNSLNPNSQFYKSLNLGFPNEYDKAHGYSGDYLMVHGECRSVGCYAMTNQYIGEIYHYVESALRNGQDSVDVHIYPFRMTNSNMQRHKNSTFHAFWQELKPGYDYFAKHGHPAHVAIDEGKYAVSPHPVNKQDERLKYAFTETE